MGKRTVVTIAAAVAALVVGAVAAYAWDSSRDDLIAKGVRVGGVDVGGLRASAARAKLRSELVTALSRPVQIRFRDRSFNLSPRRVGLHSDVDAMVDEAVAASRKGGLIGRVWRGITGGEVESDQAPLVAYSRPALRHFVHDVAVAVDRRARNATVSPTAANLTTLAAKNGLRLRARQLRSDIAAELDSQAGDRVVEARAMTLKPKVTTDELADQYPWYITIDRSGFRLRLFHRLKLVKAYPIAVGRQGLETPAGLYNIQDKQVNPSWHVPNSKWAGKLAGKVIPPGPQDPIKARWMGVNGGAGIHGTDELSSLGTAASHGCIRMAIPDVIDLYNQVPTGTPVFIA